jgi:hypothetical protein
MNAFARHWWLTPVILAAQEAEIGRIVVQPGQIVCVTISQKKKKKKRISGRKKNLKKKKFPSQKRTGGVAQGVGPEFKPQNHTHTHTQRMNALVSFSYYPRSGCDNITF